MKVGICASGNNDNFENIELIKVLSEQHEVIVFHPKDVSFIFKRGEDAKIFIKDKDISDLRVLIVRLMGKNFEEISLLVKTFESLNKNKLVGNETIIFDNPERYQGRKPSKTFSTLSRHDRKIGTSSYMFRSSSQVELLIDNIDFPVLTKPTGGAHGNGVQVFNNKDELIVFVKKFFKENKELLLIQSFEKFVKEFRVMVVGLEIIGVALKIKNDDSIVANRAHCKEWVKEELTSELANFVIDSYKRQKQPTIMGLDVGMTEDGTFHMIEENYAPQWEPFQDATGINVAEKILQWVNYYE
ncbi:MAG TPA: ATP-grasp domain-containing protein [Caldisericia bacterium]|nr:ATP-grasp domain-containing protein [Caldisericia bacterium]